MDDAEGAGGTSLGASSGSTDALVGIAGFATFFSVAASIPLITAIADPVFTLSPTEINNSISSPA